MSALKDPDWKWYFGTCEEEFCEGPFDTKEEALEVADGYGGGFIIEAYKQPFDLARQFDAERFIEDVEDNNYDLSNPDGDPLIDVSREQLHDLEAMVRSTIEAWQQKHSLVFTPWMFHGSRNLEHVKGILTDPDTLDQNPWPPVPSPASDETSKP